MDYGLLDQADEDALHKTRMLNVEERPFKRLSKRILTPNTFLYNTPTLLPTPPPDANSADEEAAALVHKAGQEKAERKQWREDALVDFAAFEASIIRIQLIRNSNEQERERYAAEKIRIIETAQAVRDNTAELRVQLEEAQNTLALRKTWDELAQKITSNRMLRTREEQHAQQEKLRAEIADLEQEARDFTQTWAERKEQYGRITEECRQMLRMIRNEPEEADPKESEGAKEDGRDTTGRTGDVTSGVISGAATPKRESGEATPMHVGIQSDNVTPSKLATQRARLHTTVSTPITNNSRAASPARLEAADTPLKESVDTDMTDAKLAKMEPDEPGPEEGRKQPIGSVAEDKMDVT